MWTLLLVALGGCGTKTSCDTVTNDFCTHEVACGRSPSQADCQAEFATTWTCNAGDDLASQRTACATRLEDLTTVGAPGCAERFPIECSDVLCSQEKGCDFTTTVTTDTSPEPYVTPSGGTGAAPPTHSGSQN